MRRMYAFLVVLFGCDDMGADFALTDFGVPQTPQLETSSPTAERESLYAPDAATLPVVSPLSPGDCDDAAQFQNIFGACPVQPPEIDSCTLEGLTCLYPVAPAADAGEHAESCYDAFACSFGLWSPLGERCPGPWEFNPGPPAMPPLASTPPSSVPTVSPPSVSAPGVPPVVSSVPASSIGVTDAGEPLPPQRDAGTSGDAGVISDAATLAAPLFDAAPLLDAAVWDGAVPDAAAWDGAVFDAGAASIAVDASAPLLA